MGSTFFNFPSKTSHILQPLDKLFNLLKTKYDQKRADANMMAQRYVGTSKAPILCGFAMAAVSNNTIREAFRETGICPLDRAAISDDLLVGTPAEIIEKETPKTTPIVSPTSHPNMPLAMEVFEGDSDTPLGDLPSTSCEKEVQTDAIKSLPCSECIQNDVSLHPAVAAGVVDIELASVFIPDAVSRSTDAKPTRSRKCTKGRCITSESELQRMREKVDGDRQKEAKKKQKSEEKEKRRKEKEELQKEKLTAKENKERLKRELDQETERVKGRKIVRGKCSICKNNVPKRERVVCVLCSWEFHRGCVPIAGESFNMICELCDFKTNQM